MADVAYIPPHIGSEPPFAALNSAPLIAKSL